MGRKREYDENAVLTNAMHAFRQKGYWGVSIKELETATNLNTGSIYNSFGDKEGLFTAALAHYKQTVVRRRIGEHALPEAGMNGLRNLFLSLLEEPSDESFGCLVTNSAVEFGGGREMPEDVTASLRLFAEVMSARLTAAQRTGAIAIGANVAAMTTQLLALYQGVLVLLRSGWDKASLREMIDTTFDRLKEESHGS